MVCKQSTNQRKRSQDRKSSERKNREKEFAMQNTRAQYKELFSIFFMACISCVQLTVLSDAYLPRSAILKQNSRTAKQTGGRRIHSPAGTSL